MVRSRPRTGMTSPVPQGDHGKSALTWKFLIASGTMFDPPRTCTMNNPQDARRCLIHLLLLLLATVLVSGCTPLDLHMRFPWQDDEAEMKRPRKIVAFWSDTVMHQQGKPGVRGFGGRVFFYGEDEGKSLEVDGALIVYAFDADRHDPATQTAGEEVRLHRPAAERPSQPVANGAVVQLLVALGWRAGAQRETSAWWCDMKARTGPW